MTDCEHHCVLLTAGSAGDMYPFMGLAKALQGLGRRVTVMGPAFHRDLVQQAALPFIGLGTHEEYLKVIGNPDIWDPRKAFAALLQDYGSRLIPITQTLAALASEARCVVIAHPLMLPAVGMARETGADIKIVGAYLAPSNLRTCHDPLNMGPLRIPRWMPMAWREALWRSIDKTIVDPVAVAETNAARSALSLRPIRSFLAHVQAVPDLSVTLFPSWFAQACPDWPRPLCVGDFPLFDPVPGQALPPELTRFLAAADKPLVFTPGTGQLHAAAYFMSAVAAVKRLGRRAILLTSHRAQAPERLPDSVLWLPYVSLAALLPHAAALVHHGGIGTTAEALRAGVPQLVVPFAWDQFDNGARVAALGVGATLRASRLSTRRLTRRLAAVLSSSAMQSQCSHVAARFNRGMGTMLLCLEIESALGLAPDDDKRAGETLPASA